MVPVRRWTVQARCPPDATSCHLCVRGEAGRTLAAALDQTLDADAYERAIASLAPTGTCEREQSAQEALRFHQEPAIDRNGRPFFRRNVPDVVVVPRLPHTEQVSTWVAGVADRIAPCVDDVREGRLLMDRAQPAEPVELDVLPRGSIAMRACLARARIWRGAPAGARRIVAYWYRPLDRGWQRPELPRVDAVAATDRARMDTLALATRDVYAGIAEAGEPPCGELFETAGTPARPLDVVACLQLNDQGGITGARVEVRNWEGRAPLERLRRWRSGGRSRWSSEPAVAVAQCVEEYLMRMQFRCFAGRGRTVAFRARWR
jgi:hypothetical protein